MIHNQAKKIQESSHDLYTLKIKIIVYIWARKCMIGVLYMIGLTNIFLPVCWRKVAPDIQQRPF